MAINPNWPLTVTSVAFNADPFDSTQVPTYVDISKRVRAIDGAPGGRQYELNVVTTGEATLTLDDPDEALNPTNPSSPWYPGVKLFRRFTDQAMWPPAPIGAAVNLLNANCPLPGGPYDPGFETYALGSTPYWVGSVGHTGPVVSATTPHSGSQCLAWTVASSAAAQGVTITAATIPGQQYTASVYVRQSSASTQQISVVGGPAGSATATTGAYVRLSVTFTATLPMHLVQVATTGTAVAGTVLLDDVQLEVGATASAYTTTGPVIYSNFSGFLDQLPAKWTHQGTRGTTTAHAVDAFGILANQLLSTEYVNAVRAKGPAYYWRLNEPAGATSFSETSGNGGPALSILNSQYGASAVAAGTSLTIAGNPSTTGVSVTGTTGTYPHQATSVLSVGHTGSPPISLGGSGATQGMSIAFWFSSTTSATTEAVMIRDSQNIRCFKVLLPVSCGATVIAAGGQTGGLDAGDSFIDGKPHLVVATWSLSAGTSLLTVWIDGVERLLKVDSAVTDFGTATPNTQMTEVQLFGRIDPFLISGGIQGTIADLALWNRTLSSAEVLDLWAAGQGYPGDMPGDRINRYLSYFPVAPPDIATGDSQLGPSVLSDKTTILDAVQSVVVSDNGNFYQRQDGYLVYRGRSARYYTLTPKLVFGENAAAGEIPYEADIEFGYDAAQVFTDVEITRNGGITAVGGAVAARYAQQKALGTRSASAVIGIASDLETQDAADWQFAAHSNVSQRVPTLSVKPSANPALWAAMLALRNGDRVTVKRRTAAGYTMSTDQFIEKVEWTRKPGEWLFKVQMSPVSPISLNLQPGLFDDGTWGRFDQTFIFAY